MRVLGIESSCDETAVALVAGEGDRVTVERDLVASQAARHAEYGGVVPEVAAREHVDALFPLLVASGVARDGAGVDAVAVTAGPGLVPALRVGVELGKALAWAWGKPLVAVNHMEGHVYSVLLGGERTIEFPALVLLVSGGHTELVLMRGHGQYERLGATRDDAAGEAFDKVAKLLGLGYPGGPVVSREAERGNPSAIDFPRPMLGSQDYDFSFSGLKTAVGVWVRANESGSRGVGESVGIGDVCASFQEAVVETLVAKTMRAVGEFRPKSLVLAGGVAANKRLRDALTSAILRLPTPVSFLVPDLKYSGDNAAMIAAAGYFRARNGEFVDPLTLEADPGMRLG